MSNEISNLDLPEKKPSGFFASKKFRLASFFVLLFVMAAGFCYSQGFFDKQAALPRSHPMAPIPTQPAIAPKNSGFAEIAATVGPDTSGQIRQLTDYQAQRQLAEAEKKVRELNKDIAEIGQKEIEARQKAQKNNAIPQVVVSPPPSQVLLPEPTKTEPGKARAQREPSAAESWKVVSIQGVNGSITATVTNGRGKTVLIRPGSSWNGGKIISITRDGVAIMRDGHSHFLKF